MIRICAVVAAAVVCLGADALSDEQKAHRIDVTGASHDCIAAAKMKHAPGWAPGCVALGSAYLEGDLVDSAGKVIPIDYRRASYYLDLGCRSADDAVACSSLAEMYEKGRARIPDREGADVALELYKRACDSKAPKSEAACQALASRLLGRGTESKDKKEAVGYFVRAVDVMGSSCAGGDDFSCDAILHLFK
jgi:TPR repeat protein